MLREDAWQGQSNNLSYTYENGRVAGYQYDADRRATISSEGNQSFYSDYDARGLLIRYNTTHSVWNTVDQNIVSRFYNGDGREVKRQKTVFAEDPNSTEWPYGSWTFDVPTYYIRSSVLGGETLTEVNSLGRKIKTNVIAAGAKIATQQEYYGGSPSEAVFFENSDASGMSRQTISSSGVAFEGDGGEVSPVEADPMGGNVGTTTPYLEILQPYEPPQEFPDLLPMTMDSPLYVNGQRVTCSLDGMGIPCSIGLGMLGHSADIDFRNTDPWVLSGLGISWREVWDSRTVGPAQPYIPPGGEQVPPGGGITVQTVEHRFVGYEYYFSSVSWRPHEQTTSQDRDLNTVRDDLGAFLDRNKNCAGLLAAIRMANTDKLSHDLKDLSILDGRTDEVLDMTLGELDPDLDRSITVRNFKGKDSFAETIGRNIVVYGRYFSDPERNTSEARGAVVFHEILHVIYGGGHSQIADRFRVTRNEPPYILPPIPSNFRPLDADRQTKWMEKFKSDYRFLWDGQASGDLQNWIDNDCQNPKS